MRTTLEIDRKLLDDAMAASGAPTKTAAVHLGLKALVDQAARRRLAALRGTIPDVKAPPRRRPMPVDASR
jgi:Arc/MetJ family transcription regulator